MLDYSSQFEFEILVDINNCVMESDKLISLCWSDIKAKFIATVRTTPACSPLESASEHRLYGKEK